MKLKVKRIKVLSEKQSRLVAAGGSTTDRGGDPQLERVIAFYPLKQQQEIFP